MPDRLDRSKVSRRSVIFPDPEKASPAGLLAFGGNLEPETLISAYSQGIFPWYSAGDPILWWTPDPRCVLFPADFRVSARSLRRIRNSHFSFSIDYAFADVINACAEPRRHQDGTWLLREMREAYIGLHHLNVAHSVEIWLGNALVGGIYGVAIGRAFFGESMFRKVSEASRAALCCLVHNLRDWGFLFLDCQQASPHMLKMGAAAMPRKEFLTLVSSGTAMPPYVSWRQPPRELPDFRSGHNSP